jgi:hypothetical protein
VGWLPFVLREPQTNLVPIIVILLLVALLQPCSKFLPLLHPDLPLTHVNTNRRLSPVLNLLPGHPSEPRLDGHWGLLPLQAVNYVLLLFLLGHGFHVLLYDGLGSL